MSLLSYFRRPKMAVTLIPATTISRQLTKLHHKKSFLSRCNKKMTVSVGGTSSFGDLAASTIRIHPRRLLLFMGSIPFLSIIKPALCAPLSQLEEPEIIRTWKLPSGVRVQDIIDGDGLTANEGDVVEFNYVCRRANGYFVYSTVDQFTGEAMPVTLALDERQMIKGLKDVIIGMKPGGKRRALIPPSVGYINDNLKPIPEEFGPRRSLMSHANEPLVFEVETKQFGPRH